MIFGKRINKYYLRYAHLFLLGLISLVLVDYANLQIPKIYRILLTGINSGYADDARKVVFTTEVLLNDICLPVLVILAVMAVGRFLWRVCFFGASVGTEAKLRQEMFEHVGKLSQEYFSTHKVGSLMALFTNDLSAIEESFGWGVMMFFDASIIGVLAVYDMIRLQPVLALLSVVPMIFLIAIGIILNRYMNKKWDEKEEAFSKISDFSQEVFSGLAVVKAFVKEAKELWQFKKLNKNNENANVEFVRLSVLLRSSVMLFVESVVAVILGFGGYLVWQGSTSAEALLEFIGYFMAIVWPVMAVSELIDLHSRGKTSLKRITELLDADITVKDREGAVDAGRLSGKIEFKDLTFTYPAKGYANLKGVSFTVEAGENVGVVGQIGSGKTTLVDLIVRLYNVEDGTLFLDDKDVNSLTIGSVRRNIAYVPQDNFLFSDTIENNVAYATDEFDEDKVKESAALACVSGDIENFTDGYKTVLGERGVTVSGGQKQRISIARALMKDAPILILDDSVSAVDTETEKTILENLKKTRKGKTTLLIAHRISTVENMDKILFLSGGKVVGFGKHAELLKTCPEYARAVDLQRLEDEKKEEESLV